MEILPFPVSVMCPAKVEVAGTRVMSRDKPHRPSLFNSVQRKFRNSPIPHKSLYHSYIQPPFWTEHHGPSYSQTTNIGDGNSNCGNMAGSFNTTSMSDKDARIMCWLSPPEPNTRHQSVRTDTVDSMVLGIGFWKQASFGSGRG